LCFRLLFIVGLTPYLTSDFCIFFRAHYITLGGSAGAQIGGAFKLDFKEGSFIFDIAFIFGGRIEANWGKRDEK